MLKKTQKSRKMTQKKLCLSLRKFWRTTTKKISIDAAVSEKPLAFDALPAIELKKVEAIEVEKSQDRDNNG